MPSFILLALILNEANVLLDRHSSQQMTNIDRTTIIDRLHRFFSDLSV